MSGTASSRRVYPTKDKHATATGAETERTTGGVQSHKANINRSPQAAQRETYTEAEADCKRREAAYRIERQREQQQAARYFRQLEKSVVRRV